MFRRIVLKNAYMRRKMFEDLLESVPLLKSLNVRPVTLLHHPTPAVEPPASHRALSFVCLSVCLFVCPSVHSSTHIILLTDH